MDQGKERKNKAANRSSLVEPAGRERAMRWSQMVGVMLVGCGGAYDVHTVAYDERHGVRGLLDLLVPEATGAPRLGLLLLHPGWVVSRRVCKWR